MINENCDPGKQLQSGAKEPKAKPIADISVLIPI